MGHAPFRVVAAFSTIVVAFSIAALLPFSLRAQANAEVNEIHDNVYGGGGVMT